MTGVELVRRVLAAFELLRIDYVTVGSFAVNAYVEPRSTNDADFVLQLDQLDLGSLVAALGDDFSIDPQMSFESITMTSRYKLTHRRSLFTIELFGLTHDEHDLARFRRRVRGSVGGLPAFILSPEDVVVTKLRWGQRGRRSKDIEDIENMLAVHRATLDFDYIRGWARQHGTLALLEQLLAETGEAPGTGLRQT
jgi:hypothetical protein